MHFLPFLGLKKAHFSPFLYDKMPKNGLGVLTKNALKLRNDNFFLMIRRPPRSTRVRSSAASDVYKRQFSTKSYIKLQALLRSNFFTELKNNRV